MTSTRMRLGSQPVCHSSRTWTSSWNRPSRSSSGRTARGSPRCWRPWPSSRICPWRAGGATSSPTGIPRDVRHVAQPGLGAHGRARGGALPAASDRAARADGAAREGWSDAVRDRHAQPPVPHVPGCDEPVVRRRSSSPDDAAWDLPLADHEEAARRSRAHLLLAEEWAARCDPEGRFPTGLVGRHPAPGDLSWIARFAF